MACDEARAPRSRSEPLFQSVYVWQREWNSAVTNAVLTHRAAFQSCLVLNAEISWRPEGARTVTVPLDFQALRQTKQPVGLALRIGSYPGPFDTKAVAFQSIRTVVSNMLNTARAERVEVSELHLDFDCAESKLGGYATWLEGLKTAFPGMPLTITALPSWLNRRREFARVIAPLSSYVLQVHSLERPNSISDRGELCDPAAAKNAVLAAEKFAKPFLVALPTYSYLLAFDESGKFAGLQAESSTRVRGANGTILELRSSPKALAGLVRDWTAAAPRQMRGLIWYRLPVATDTLNWAWPTLEAVMQGIPPVAELKIEVRSPQSALYEIILQNVGSDEYAGPVNVALRYGEGTALASDGLGNFTITNRAAHALNLISSTNFARLPARAERKIGWMRTTRPLEKPIESVIETRKN